MPISDITGQISEAAQTAHVFALALEGRPNETQMQRWWRENWGWVVGGSALLWLSTIGVQAIPQWIAVIRR